MLGHLGLNVPDLDAAKAYYGRLMPHLDYVPFLTDETQCPYMPNDGKRGAYLFFYESRDEGTYSRHASGLQHLAFVVPTRTAVQRVHEVVSELGGNILHEPRVFPEYPQPYFATFWLDRFGFMLEAVCHRDED